MDKCTSINLTHEELIVGPSSSSQSGDFNQLSQGNLEDKQKSQIWLSQSNPFNSSNPWSIPSNKGLETKEERNKRKHDNTNWPQDNTLTNQKNSKESITNLITQSNKKVSKDVHEIKKINDVISISTRLDTIFNRCRKVLPSVKRILIDKRTHSSDYSCIYSRKENIKNMIELFDVTSAHHQTTSVPGYNP